MSNILPISFREKIRTLTKYRKAVHLTFIQNKTVLDRFQESSKRGLGINFFPTFLAAFFLLQPFFATFLQPFLLPFLLPFCRLFWACFFEYAVYKRRAILSMQYKNLVTFLGGVGVGRGCRSLS
jgi:hypothetical protein